MRNWLIAVVIIMLGGLGAAAIVFLQQEPKRGQTGNLVIYSATDRRMITPLLQAFSERYPGIKLHYEEFNSLELEQWLRTHENEAGPDIVISSASDLQLKLVNDGYAQDYRPPQAGRLPGWAQWNHQLYGFTYEPVVMVYNRKAFAHHPVPQTHEALAVDLRQNQSFYEGRVVTYDIRNSGTGYLIATQDELHSSLSGRLTEGLGRAQALAFCCTADLMDTVAKGYAVLGYNLLGAYALKRADADPRIGVILPRDYTLVLTRSAFISRLAPNTANARTYMDFILSRQGQEALAQRSEMTVLDSGVTGRHTIAALKHNHDTNFVPIKLEPALMVYLDKWRRQQFLHQWNNALQRAFFIN